MFMTGAALLLAAAAEAPAYDPAPYLADLERAKAAIAESYPNLNWALAERKLDLPQLALDTAVSIGAAQSDRAARQLFEEFLQAFGDGHLYVTWPGDEDKGEPRVVASLCGAIGYEEADRPAAPPYELAGFERLKVWGAGDGGDAAFPAWIATRPDGRRLGLLRIGSFWEWGYADYCRAAVEAIGAPKDGECDRDCADAIEAEATRRIVGDFRRGLERLKAARIDALIVDVSGNDGGSPLTEPLARMLTTKALRSGAAGFVRGPAWARWAEDAVEAIDRDIPHARGATLRLLAQARDRAAQIKAEAEDVCDRAGVWDGQAPDCDVVAKGFLFDAGLLPYAPPGTLDGFESRFTLFNPSWYPYEEGVWTGPLAVLVDERTASAAETFAALLRDNGAAVLVGEPTYGAGCGWELGQSWTTLPATGAKLYVPDCVAFTADGANAVGGLEPDVVVPWRSFDNPYQRARRAAETLSALDLATLPPRAPPVSRTKPDGR